MMKQPGWEGRFIEYLRNVSRRNFEPSDNDCAMFSANGILAMTGDDYAAEFRGKYTTVDEGLALLNQAGFADHIAYAATKFEELVSPLMAQRGDLVVVNEGNDACLGLVQGERIYVMTYRGLGIVSLTRAVRAFRV